MTGTRDMNIVLGQGDTAKDAQNIRKQNLDMNQQYVAQNNEEKTKVEKSRVRSSETRNRIEADADKGKRKQSNPKDKKRATNDPENEDPSSSEGGLIDITV